MVGFYNAIRSGAILRGAQLSLLRPTRVNQDLVAILRAGGLARQRGARGREGSVDVADLIGPVTLDPAQGDIDLIDAIHAENVLLLQPAGMA